MPSRTLRKTVLTRARRVVVKLGTQLLTDDGGRVDPAQLSALAAQVEQLVERGIQVCLVSSGAIGMGWLELHLPKRPTDIGVLQAVAAVGQSGLMHQWHEAFAQHDRPVAQMLLNRDDFEERSRYLNIRNCITELERLGAIPIVNENDTVSVDEIRLGDNDILAALVANAIRADALIMLTVVEGLADPDGEVLDIIHDAADAMALSRSDRSGLGSGGMQTKLEAAQMVTDAGEVAVIANGREPNVLVRLMDAEKLGTVFVPAKRKMASRKRWIGLSVRPAGTIVVDDGALRAIVQRGKSLLAIGITHVTGRFEKGDVVSVRDARGVEVARGLVNYSAEETRLVMGKRSNQLEKALGRQAYDEVIHRNHLVLAAPR